jgi:CheY-like chemotaxis protein
MSRRLRILLVDDTAMNRDLAGRFLQSAGHTVVEARDGVEAVQQAANADFDLILMDIRMPRMDGTEAARRIRDLAGPRGLVPIVAVTADNTPSHKQAFETAGINRHLAKPFTCDELLRMVDAIATQNGHLPVSVTTSPRPEPDRPAQPRPVLDVEVLEQLASRLSKDNLDAYLRTLMGRVDDLLGMLRQPAGTNSDALGDLVHELQGTAGFLGFAALGAMLHAFEGVDPAAGDERTAKAAELLAVAEQSRAALSQRLVTSSVDGIGAAIAL